MHGSFLRPATLVLAATALLSGCADFSGIAPEATLRSATGVGLKDPPPLIAAELDAISAPNPWWEQFGDPRLDALVEQALQNSPSLRVAQVRTARARAVIARVDADRQVQVTGSAEASRQRFSGRGFYPSPIGGSEYEIGTVQATASYEFDWFGKNRAALNVAVGQTAAAQADAQAARLLLAAQVTRHYIALLRLQAQRELLEQTLVQRQRIAEISALRFKAGLESELEPLLNNPSVPEIRRQMAEVQEQAALLDNATAALTGRPLFGQGAQATPLGRLEKLRSTPVPENLMLDLLGRRPDITAARWRIEASLHDVNLAKTQFYPNVNVVGVFGLSSVGLGNIAASNTDQWNVGPAIRLPLFDGGRLRAQLRGKAIDVDAAIETYNLLVVDAAREAADQWVSAAAIQQQQAAQHSYQTDARALYAIAQQRFAAGLTHQNLVLQAEGKVLDQQRIAIELTARALDTQVLLVRAVGGAYPIQAAPAAN
jgi:NodT family efflux transporter outer membrane factor (OMF) lipoprotein